MSAQSIPTDSILRRHFEQIARSVDLPSPPQDSILSRHYHQLLDSRLASPSPKSAPPRPAAKAAAAAPAASPTPVPSAAATNPASAPTPAPSMLRATHSHAQPGQPASTPQPKAEPKGLFARILAKLFGG